MELNIDVIKRLMAEKLLTQDSLSKKAKLSPTTVSLLMSGKRRSPNISTVSKLAKALGVKPQKIIIFKDRE